MHQRHCLFQQKAFKTKQQIIQTKKKKEKKKGGHTPKTNKKTKSFYRAINGSRFSRDSQDVLKVKTLCNLFSTLLTNCRHRDG